MKYYVLDTFTAQTTQGERTLLPGQIITIPKEKSFALLTEGKITPVERTAYRIYSEILQAFLWVVETDHDTHALRTQNVNEPIYTGREIQELKKVSKTDLKTILEVKTIFPMATVEEITGGNE